MSDCKTQHLQSSGTLHPHPDSVSDPLFTHRPFFDARDLLQVRYEMIRAHTKGTTLQELADRFGMSVPTCVRLKRHFRKGGIQALYPKGRGPQGPHKINAQIMSYAEGYLKKYGHTSIRELTNRINEHFQIHLHYSSIYRMLSKKNFG